MGGMGRRQGEEADQLEVARSTSPPSMSAPRTLGGKSINSTTGSGTADGVTRQTKA